MGQPILLPAAFDGMVKDFPRNNLPKGRCWNMVNLIPSYLEAAATRRGGWTFASASLTAVDASAVYISALHYAPFTAGDQLLAIDNSAKLVKIVGGVNTLITGTANVPVQNPFMHNQTVVIPSPDGTTTAPQKYDGTTLAALGATAPAGKYGCVFNNYTWLAGNSANPNRAFASAVGDPTAYSQTGTSASYIDTSFPIKGVAALPNVMLLFGDTRTARLRGTTPPPGTDMSLDDPIFNHGVIDARSIAVNGSVACFANATGVFLTNGTAFPEDLTRACGISKYWRDVVVNSGFTITTVAGGWFGDLYVVSLLSGSALVDVIAFDTTKRTAYRFNNINATCFAKAGGFGGQELYAGSRSTPRVMRLSGMWLPSATNKTDGDGDPIGVIWETPFYDAQALASQRWRDVYLLHDIRDAASDNPYWDVSWVTSPEQLALYNALSSTIGETTTRTLSRVRVNRKSRGMGFMVRSFNAASYARLYGIGATVYAREGSRRDV